MNEYQTKIKEEAVRLHRLGFKVIPVTDPLRPDGKKPTCAWKDFQDHQSEADILRIFESSNVGGIALLTGKGIEVIDIDLKYSLDDGLMSKFLDQVYYLLGEDFYKKVIIAKTVSGGYHVFYKTDVGEGNLKLASRYTLDSEKKNDHDTTRVLFETRGIGGYVLIAPSNGYQYDHSQITVSDMQHIEDGQRNKLIEICRSFDETIEMHRQIEAVPVHISTESKSTIEAFNEAHDPIEFLTSEGWQFKYSRGGNDHYVRPGKGLNEGVGAGYNKSLKLVRVFTSSTQFDPNKSYNAFQTYAVLYFAGDYSKAASDLYHKGYGQRLSKKIENYNSKLEVIVSGNETAKAAMVDSARMDSIFSKRFSIKNVPAAIENHLFCVDENTGENVPIASFGDIVTIVGAAKSRKSAIANSIIAAMLQDSLEFPPVLNFTGIVKNRNIIVLDTEQNEPDFYKSQKQIYRQANLHDDIPNFYAFNISEEVMADRLQFLEHAITRIGNVGVLLLDGIVDLCEDYNDQKLSRQLIEHVKILAVKHKILFIPVLHNARSTGSARGHLGNELINKSKAVIKVTKDSEGEGDSTVAFEYIRGNREPAKFQFTHDLNGNLIKL